MKLFDVKTIRIDSPIKSREFFNITYFIKGMAEIKGDVMITFWIQDKESKIELGKDTIYLGTFEEKTETVELFMPNSLKSGVYDIYINVAYENYSAESYRKIEVISSSTGMEIINLDENEIKDTRNITEIPYAGIKFFESIKNLVSNLRKGFSSITKFVGNNKIYSFVELGILLLIASIWVLYWIFKKRKPKDMIRLKNLKGLKVYSENGKYIGRLKEAYLEDGNTRVYGYLIKLNKKMAKKLGKKNILVRHKHIRAAKHIMLIEEKIAEHLENLNTRAFK
ncbi:MAG: PRC-barrel domain-containing protein [archaeon]